MEEVCGDTTPCCLVHDMLEVRGQEVCEEYLPTARRLLVNVLQEIPYH